MGKGRLEAFSDGVFAIIITIMVLELRAPQGDRLDALLPVLPAMLGYVLSFVYVGIYWNNHHHVFQAAERVNGTVLWANLHLLFWLSLVPFVTNWVGRTDFATWPVASYGVVLMLCAIAWEILRRALLSTHDPTSALARAMGPSLKEWASTLLYVFAIAAAFVHTGVACAFYCAVAAIWIVPDRRIERQMTAVTARPSPSPLDTRAAAEEFNID